MLAGAALSPLLAAPDGATAGPVTTAARANIEVRRLSGNPIIRPDMLPGKDGDNINGPSLIRVPAWLPNRLGNYYLYFAHHQGQYIRLAYADKLTGPWKIHEPGVLSLAEVPACKSHLASPDVLVDEERRELRMYFHGPSRSGQGQESYVARSQDGLHFTASPEALGRSYFRVFHWRDQWFALAKGGEAYRSADGVSGFERGAFVLPGPAPGPDDESPEPHARHVALHQVGDDLWIYYSNIGDAPERILRSSLPLVPDWRNWKSGPPEEVLRPETEFEGAKLPVVASRSGAITARENALRDPAIFTDTDGRVYLLYSVAGESGLAIAELVGKPSPKGKESTPLSLPGSEPFVFRQIGDVEL
ncbi:MAG: hypothetical protein PSW75_08000, partial [bacterium]|nr:hypothetical protein [bacterium]